MTQPFLTKGVGKDSYIIPPKETGEILIAFFKEIWNSAREC